MANYSGAQFVYQNNTRLIRIMKGHDILRPLECGDDWRKIRIGIRLFAEGGNILGTNTPRLAIGINSGSSNAFGANRNPTRGFIGVVSNSTSWVPRNSATAYGDTGFSDGIKFFPIERGWNGAVASYSLGPAECGSGSISNVNGILSGLIVQIEREVDSLAANYTTSLFGTWDTGAAKGLKEDQFYSMMETEGLFNQTFHIPVNRDGLGNPGTYFRGNFITDQYRDNAPLDTLNISYWSEDNVELEVIPLFIGSIAYSFWN